MRKQLIRLPILIVCLILVAASLLPLFISDKASAAGQISNRSLTLSSAVPSDTGVTYTFTFTPPTTSAIEGLKFKACTTAVGAYPGGVCTAPVGMTAGGDGFSNAAWLSQSGWTNATNFAVDLTGANDCTASPNELCANRTEPLTEGGTPVTIAFNTIKNPSSPNTAFFVGISTYSDNAWTLANLVDFGATAAAVVQTLTAYAAVAEVLQFCVGSTLVDDADTTLIATDCSTVAGTSVNIGTLDTSQLNVSPIATDGGDGNNGVAMVRTNATNGVVINYRAIQAPTGSFHLGTLRITGGACNNPGNSLVDPCIDAQGGTQAAFTPGTERFGMTIAGVNCLGTSSYGTGTAGACWFVNSDNNLEPLTNYIGKAGNIYCNICNTADAGNGYAWDESGTAVPIASSAASTVKQVDDEALVLKFAATPSITTPFGPYSVSTDFIAVPTY